MFGKMEIKANEKDKIIEDPYFFCKILYFCREKGITIYAHPIGYDQLKIIINNNGKEITSEKTYTNENVNNKIKELYLLICNKIK